MTSYNPDSWVVIRMINKDQIFYKVLGGWSSSYLGGSSWRLNSGIEEVTKDGSIYTFRGSSGSVYNCFEGSYGLRMATVDTWITMKKMYPDQVELLEDQNWLERNWNE